MLTQGIRRIIYFVILILVVVAITLPNYVKDESKVDIPKGVIGEELIQSEFFQAVQILPYNYETIHPEGRLIHNNGMPIKNDVLTYGGGQKLFGIFQMVINDADYEYYIFSPIEKMNIDEIRNNALEQKSKALEFIVFSKESQ